MAVTVVRRTGIIGMAGTIAIKINGEKVGKVKTEQQIEVDLPNNKARLNVSQFGVRSNELEVNDGEIIELTTPKWSSPILFSIILLPSISNFIPNFQHQTIYIVIYLVVAMVLLFGMKWYNIKKI